MYAIDEERLPNRVHVAPVTLSDGSLVYDVKLPWRWLKAVTKADAFALAEKVAQAINEHTNDTADVAEVELGKVQ